jgi:hypothetical protein
MLNILNNPLQENYFIKIILLKSNKYKEFIYLNTLGF